MKIIKILQFVILTSSLGLYQCKEKHPPSMDIPDLLYADSEIMVQMKKDFLDGSPDVVSLISRVISCADEMIDAEPFSVMNKGIVPPSGDKHDYISQGPYWWPDTAKPDGLPYIRRDGVVNPERDKFTDRQNLRDLIDATELLSKAYFFTEDEKYAQKAASLLEVWFIDDATKMNPNLEYGQGIPGITEGRGIGIIETSSIGKIADAVKLIRASTAWDNQKDEQLTQWCLEYLDWLLTSEKGKKESIHPNNHGTWYDVQAMSLAIFTGQDSIASALANRAKTFRIDAHIMEDGSQPKELARTVSFNYSAMNLRGLFHIAYLADKLGIDL